MSLFWLLGALCIISCNYTAIIILKFGLDFWVLSPKPTRFGLDTENLRIKPGSMYNIYQLKMGFVLNSERVVNLDKDFLGPALQRNKCTGWTTKLCTAWGRCWLVSQHYEVLFQCFFLVFSLLCTGRFRQLHPLSLIPRHSADQTVIKGKFWLQIDSEI